MDGLALPLLPEPLHQGGKAVQGGLALVDQHQQVALVFTGGRTAFGRSAPYIGETLCFAGDGPKSLAVVRSILTEATEGQLDVDGIGFHRLWYVGGRYAYASALLDGFVDYIFVTIDMADPTRPELVGRWWLPGMR